MSDLISRQAAIDALEAAKEIYVDRKTILAKTQDIINNLPSAQPEQHWTPCGEKLPEDIRPVIVTWKNNDPESYYQYIVGKHFIGTAHYKNGTWLWYSSTTEDMLAEYGRCDSEEFDEAIEVIAWMPLPEPYAPDINDGKSNFNQALSKYKASFNQAEEDTDTKVLDKIRAEIDQKQYDFMDDKDYDEGIRFGLMLAYQILDKYKTESEVQDADNN